MCGTPHLSRRTSTGADNPGAASGPLVWGSGLRNVAASSVAVTPVTPAAAPAAIPAIFRADIAKFYPFAISFVALAPG